MTECKCDCAAEERQQIIQTTCPVRVDGADIQAALDALEKMYPGQQYDIWVQVNQRHGYTAYLRGFDVCSTGDSGWGNTAVEAAQCLIARVGPRDRETMRRKEIKTLKAKLAELEGNCE